MSALNCSDWLSLRHEPMVLISQPTTRNFYERMMLTRQFYHLRGHQRADSPGGAIISTGQLLNKLASDYAVPDTSREDEKRDRAQLPPELRVATPRPCSSSAVRTRMRQSEWRCKLGLLLSPNNKSSPRAKSAKIAAAAATDDKSANNNETAAAANGHPKESIAIVGNTTQEPKTTCSVLSLPSSVRSNGAASAKLLITSPPSSARSVSASTSRSMNARQSVVSSVQQAQPTLFLEARGRTLGVRCIAPEYLSSSRHQPQRRSQSAFGRIESRHAGHSGDSPEPLDKPLPTEVWGAAANDGAQEVSSARLEFTEVAQLVDKDLTTVYPGVAGVDGHFSRCTDCFYCRVLKGRGLLCPNSSGSNREEVSSVDLVLRYYEEKDRLQNGYGEKNNNNQLELEQVSRHEHCFHNGTNSSMTSSTRVGRAPSPRSAKRPILSRKGPGQETGYDVTVPERPTTPASIPSNSRPPSIGGSRPSSTSGDRRQPLSFIITTRSLSLKTKYLNKLNSSHKS